MKSQFPMLMFVVAITAALMASAASSTSRKHSIAASPGGGGGGSSSSPAMSSFFPSSSMADSPFQAPASVQAPSSGGFSGMHSESVASDVGRCGYFLIVVIATVLLLAIL